MRKKFFGICAVGLIFYAGNVQAADIDSWGENRPSDALYLQYQSVFDNPLYYDQATGEVNWPANDGFAETPYSQTLGVGTWLDRFGYDGGKYVCPAGISYTMRSCAPGTEDKPYSIFVTKGATTVQAGLIAPWFDETGGGMQYLLPDSVQNLLDSGNLRRVEQREFASSDHVQPAVILQQNSMTNRIVASRADSSASNVWINFSKRFGDLRNDGKYHGSTIYGGFDRQRNEHWRDGIFLSYGTTSYASDTANAGIHDTRVGLYTSYKRNADSAYLYVDYGWQNNRLDRHVDEIYLNAHAKYHSQLAELGGEYKHNLQPEKTWQVSPYVAAQVSYLHQSAYVEKITDTFGQRVKLKNNVYAAIEPGIEFKRAVNGGSYGLRLGCKCSLAGADPKVRFNYANYDRTTYSTSYNQDKVHFVAELNGDFDFAENWRATFNAGLQKGAHDKDLSASVMVRRFI